MLAVALAAGCGGDDTVVYVDAEVPSPSTVPVFTTVPGTQPVVFEQLWSPEPATVQVVGTGALDSDPVTVDGEPATVLAFEPGDDDTFELTLRVEQEGGRTVCVRDECGRVFVEAAGTETTAEVEAKVDEAIELAGALADAATEFPEWAIEAAEPFAGVGGTTDPATKTISVHANPGRTVDQFVTTALHEWGHVADLERMDDDERLLYRRLRGIDPELAWATPGSHTEQRWAEQPAEDFAEVMVVIWTDGEHVIRTTQLAPQPDAATLTEVAELADL